MERMLIIVACSHSRFQPNPLASSYTWKIMHFFVGILEYDGVHVHKRAHQHLNVIPLRQISTLKSGLLHKQTKSASSWCLRSSDDVLARPHAIHMNTLVVYEHAPPCFDRRSALAGKCKIMCITIGRYQNVACKYTQFECECTLVIMGLNMR